MPQVKDLRCIHVKTGEIKWLPETFVSNKQFMEAYGFIQQDLSTSENVPVKNEEPVIITDENENSQTPEFATPEEINQPTTKRKKRNA